MPTAIAVARAERLSVEWEALSFEGTRVALHHRPRSSPRLPGRVRGQCCSALFSASHNAFQAAMPFAGGLARGKGFLSKDTLKVRSQPGYDCEALVTLDRGHGQRADSLRAKKPPLADAEIAASM